MPRGKKAASTKTGPARKSAGRKTGRVNGAAQAKTAAPKKTAAQKDHNITDAVIRDFTRRAILKKNEYDVAVTEAKEIMGQYRGILKAAKKAGLDTKAMTRVILERVRDKDDVLRDEQNFIRYATLFDMPLTQADLFDGVYQPSGDDDENQKQAVFDADDLGYRAGVNGVLKTDNPFHQTEQSELWAAWGANWHKGQAQLAKGLTQPSATGRRSPGAEERAG